MGRARVDLALERPLDESVEQFVHPLDALLRQQRLGRVIAFREGECLTCVIDLRVRGTAGFELVMQFLAEADAPTGTIVYRFDWLGRKCDIHILGQES